MGKEKTAGGIPAGLILIGMGVLAFTKGGGRESCGTCQGMLKGRIPSRS